MSEKSYNRTGAGRVLAAVMTVGLVVGVVCLAVPAAAQPQVSAGYRIGPRDRVTVEVFELPDLNATRRVEADGTITLPVLGAVTAEGRTTDELADEIERLLEADYVNRASVRVELAEVLSRTVTVLGAVADPGPVGHPGDWSLLEALAAAGGLTADHGELVHVQRRADNGLSDRVSIPIDALVGRADPKLNLPVLPNDVIQVERTHTITIYLLGEVASAGAMQFKSTDDVTLLTVLARAGGLADRASPRIRIKRRDEDGHMQEIEANYKRILDGGDPDVELQDGDLVVVKESFF